MDTEIIAYDLTLMAGEIAEIFTRKPGYLGMTGQQRKKIDKIVYRYAKRTVDILAE